MKTIRKWIIALAAFVTRMPAGAFKEELALTAYELEAEGEPEPSFLTLVCEALNRYAEETLKVESAPAYYRQQLDDCTSLKDLAQLAAAGRGFDNLADAAREGKKAIDDLARATKGINFNDLEDLI